MTSGARHETRSESTATSKAAGRAPVATGPAPGRGGSAGGRQPPVGQYLGEEAGSRGSGGAQGQPPGSTRQLRCRAAARTDAPAQARCAGGRFSDRAMDLAAGGGADRRPLWTPIQRRARVATAAGDGFQLPASDRTRRPAQRAGHTGVEATAVAGTKKTPKNAAKP